MARVLHEVSKRVVLPESLNTPILQPMIIPQFKIEISDSCLLEVIIAIQVPHPSLYC
jgi:hypothetical protein